MEAGQAADFHGPMPGDATEQSDAEQAYTQAMHVGTPTWVRFPRDQWPASWHGMKDPVCPLVSALYGHPDAGGHWERHCESKLSEAGFIPIRAWRSCFWHPELHLFLVVYVDDFKLAGPEVNVAKGWQLIRNAIKTDDPHPVGLFLGCNHRAFERTLPGTRAAVRGVECDMEDFLRSCVSRYQELTGVTTLRKASTPFLPEPTRTDFRTTATDAVSEQEVNDATEALLAVINNDTRQWQERQTSVTTTMTRNS